MPKNCLKADKEGECLVCEDGYKVDGSGKCEKEEDYCKYYGYVDEKGNYCNKDCETCKKVCIKCVSGYYLNKDGVCKKNPKNCDEVDSLSGECVKCSWGCKKEGDSCVRKY